VAAVEKAEAQERLSGIKIADKVYESPDDFTLSEAETIKEHTDLTPQDLILGVQQDPTDPVFLRALAWVVLHREKKTTEWDDPRIGQSSVGLFFQVPDDEDDGEGEAARPPGSRQKRSSSARPTT